MALSLTYIIPLFPPRSSDTEANGPNDMELALTFGAVGDILAISLLIKDIVNCLNGGSSREYQDLVRSLGILNDALREVDHVLRDPRRASAHRALCDVALKSVHQIRESLQSFNGKLDKFRPNLSGPGGSGTRLKDVARKIQFKLDAKDFEKMKGDINGYNIALKMLLETMTLHAVDQNHDAVTKQLATIEGQTQQTQRELQHTNLSLKLYIWNLGRQVLGKIHFLTQATLDIQRSTSEMASTVLSISRELASFRFLLTTLERPIVDEYFTIEDALGRVFPIHLRTITSWDAFAFVLSEKFKGGRGARRVRQRQYKLIDRATRREIEQGPGINWERTFLPHRRIVMSLLCKEAQQVSATPDASRLATCPWCKTRSDSDTSVQVQCQNCNMFYTRVVELDDVELPPLPTKAREAPQFGQPAFNVALPPGWKQNHRRRKRRLAEDISNDADCSPEVRETKRAKHNISRKRKITKDDDSEDSLSDDEDVNGFVRVTIVSRQKKIKLFHGSNPAHPLSLTMAALSEMSFKETTGEESAKANFLKLLKQNEGNFKKHDQEPIGSLKPGTGLPGTVFSFRAGLEEQDSVASLYSGTGRYLSLPSSVARSPYQDEPKSQAQQRRDAPQAAERPKTDPSQYTYQAPEANAKKYPIPTGYSLKPLDMIVFFSGGTFDYNMLGNWISELAVHHYIPFSPIPNMAGELWLLLVQLSEKIKEAKQDVHSVRKVDKKEMLQDFITSGERLLEKLHKLLKTCEQPLLKAAEETRVFSTKAEFQFIETLFGQERDETESFMQGVKLFNLRFDAYCRDVILNPDEY